MDAIDDHDLLLRIIKGSETHKVQNAAMLLLPLDLAFGIAHIMVLLFYKGNLPPYYLSSRRALKL